MNDQGRARALLYSDTNAHRSIASSLQGLLGTYLLNDVSEESPFGWASVGLVLLTNGLAEPVLETGRSDASIVAGDQGAVVELCAEVARAAVGRHLACVAVRAQHAAGELVETEPFRSCQLDGAVHRRAYCRDRQRGGNIVGRLGLNQRGRHTNGLAVGVRIGDAADELEELRRADDRVGHGRRLDRFFLGDLRSAVPAVRKPVGP